MRRLDWRELAVAGSLSAAVGVVLPLQTFGGNAAIFPFPAARLLPELLGLFALFTLALLLLGRLAGRIRPALADGFFAVLVAALACVYLEAGPLSAGLPELNGGPVPELANRTRSLVDAGVWALLAAGFLATARRLRPHLHWIALALLALSLASLADVALKSAARPSVPQAPADGRLRYESQPTVVANVRYSPRRNILVFVLDSLPGRITSRLLAADAALCAEFPGFTVYPDNIGMHECTKRGVPGLVTGRHFDPGEISEADYPMTMYGTNSFVRAAEAAGWNVAFSPDLLPYGATSLPVGERIARVEKRRARDRFAFLRQTTEVPFLSLFDTVAFRVAPFFFKGPILYSRIRHAVKGRHSGEGFWGERTMYPALAARPVSDDARPFLGFFHSWGVHPPWEGDFATTVTEKFRALARLMAAYRAAGLYERSLIVVTSDHGLDEAPAVGDYPPSASAFLMVKPEGVAAPFAVSDEPTSHARIAPLVKAALAAPPGAADCRRILRDAQPLYRAEIREGTHEFFRDWPAK